jgi:hypothetical protein
MLQRCTCSARRWPAWGVVLGQRAAAWYAADMRCGLYIRVARRLLCAPGRSAGPTESEFRTWGQHSRTTAVRSADLLLLPRYGSRHILHTSQASLSPCCCDSHAGCSCHGFSWPCRNFCAYRNALHCSLAGYSRRYADAVNHLTKLPDGYEGCANDARSSDCGRSRCC